MEDQLRHRLETREAEAEGLREELSASRERSEQAEAAVRASERRNRENADAKTKDLLADMENMYQAQMLAESKASEMTEELDKLRAEAANAQKCASEEQSRFIRASELRMSSLENVSTRGS